MKYFHASDLHGDLNVLTLIGKNVDAVILTGDVFPNRTRGNVIVEQEFQEEWFKTKITPFFRSLAGRPVITVDGNHDFVSLAEMLQKYRYPGDVHAIAPNKVVEFGGHSWTGHRFIPNRKSCPNQPGYVLRHRLSNLLLTMGKATLDNLTRPSS
jgi:Icc-related predicted phosphoesterase